jgi:phosphoglycerate dehydrogenase-like enzyme
MTKRLIMVNFPLIQPDDLDLIRAVDPELEVVFVPYLEDMETRRLRATAPVEVIKALKQDLPEALLGYLPEVEMLVTQDTPVDILERAPKLRWVHCIGSGTDHFRGTGILGSHVVLTSSKGIAARSIAEFVMAQLLALAKQTPRRWGVQRAHEWRVLKNRPLYESTLGIVGLGEIGQAVARLAKAFGLRVLATRRRPPGEDLPPNVDAVFPREALRAMLGACDAVVVAAAYTADTRGLIGAGELAAMRPGSLLVDVSRGGIVEESALIEALRSGHLGGAALDVFDREPLPSDSPLWDLPTLIISPHNAVGLENYGRATIERFVDLLRDYLRGEPLRYVVDPETGY